MEGSELRLSADSNKQEMLTFLDNVFRPLPCANPKHRYPHMEICLKTADQSTTNNHQQYQLLCYSCKRENSFQCTNEKHATTELIDTLRILIEQSHQNQLKPLCSNSFQQQPEQDNADEQIKQIILSMKAALSDMKKAKTMLEEQIVRLENEKFKLENELSLKGNQSNQKLRELKELLVQILKQNNSQYFQQYVSQLKNYTEVDQSGQLTVCLTQKKKSHPQFWSDYESQIKQLNIDINEWVRAIPTVPEHVNEDQLQLQNETLAAFSYLLNEQHMKQDLQILLKEVDKFNQKMFKMKAVLQSDLHKKLYKINTIQEYVTTIQRLCENNRLSPEYMAVAKFLSGFCWFYGVGCEKNQKTGFKIFLESDECLKEKNGYGVAQSLIGYCYKNGEGVVKDWAQAVKYYRMAAEQGHVSAQNNLGYCYDNGQGVEKDLVQAVKYYRMAAEQGYASGQNNLGYSYQYGQGVEKDLAQAVKYYRMAAEQGLAAAQNGLALCYYNGEGVVKDWAQAVKYYRMAAEQGLAAAQFNLGYCYQTGVEVEKNLDEAKKYYKQAADQGNQGAINALKEMK